MHLENSICFIICTNNENLYMQCVTHINELYVPKGFNVNILAITNATSMTSGYNHAMNSSKAKYKIYLHQDTFIINKNFIYEIVKIFKQNEKLGLLGLIGCESLPDNGIWWESSKRYGKVIEFRNYFNILNFYDAIQPYSNVEAVDGLLLATQYDLPWQDHIFDGWHLYDSSQCIEFLKAGYKVGVPFQKHPWVIHYCGNEFEQSEYSRYLGLFVKNYSASLKSLRV